MPHFCAPLDTTNCEKSCFEKEASSIQPSKLAQILLTVAWHCLKSSVTSNLHFILKWAVVVVVAGLRRKMNAEAGCFNFRFHFSADFPVVLFNLKAGRGLGCCTTTTTTTATLNYDLKILNCNLHLPLFLTLLFLFLSLFLSVERRVELFAYL